MAIPLGVYIINISIYGVLLVYRMCIKGQTRRIACADATSIAMSGLLSLFYLMYIYLSKNVLDVLTCVPADPPDGLKCASCRRAPRVAPHAQRRHPRPARVRAISPQT